MYANTDINCVWRTLKRLKCNSVAGPSMLRPLHVKACAVSNVRFSFAEACTNACNKLLDGSTDLALGKYAASGSLYPSWKDTNSGDARPIASGDALCSIIGRVIMKLKRRDWRKIFEPEQQMLAKILPTEPF